jgi:hypothetical protein
MLKWSDTMKSGGGQNAHKINISRDGFNPESRRNRGAKQQSLSGLKKVTMLTLSNTVMSVSTGARVLRKSAFLRKKRRRERDRYSPPELAWKIQMAESYCVRTIVAKV